MAFIVYDIVFLIVFVIAVSIFLYMRRSNLKRDGLLFLYKTKWGMKLINYVGGKYKRTIKVLSYISIGMGYLLMVGMLYLTYMLLRIYIFMPAIVREVKVPPITPLVPYIDKIVPGLPSFFFTYWIVILAVIAITHEFSHGIFMKRYKIKIKSTGFGFFPFFFPVFPLAFVEQDEKSMIKKGNFEQMAVLSAGTFANVLTAILFFAVLWGFFMVAFTPSGIVFDGYQISAVGVANITSVNYILVNNVSYDKLESLVNETGLTKITTNSGNYVATKNLIDSPDNQMLFSQTKQIILYEDDPAINANLSGAIKEINGVKINSVDDLGSELSKYSPGDKVKIKTTQGIYEVILSENPDKKDSAYLGIGFTNQERSGIMGKIIDKASSFKQPHVNYESKFNGWSIFIYNLLWWLVLISISVALVNMLPVGIFDGGRFFYLTILSLTKNKKVAEDAFKISTYFFLFLLLVLMIFWFVSFL